MRVSSQVTVLKLNVTSAEDAQSNLRYLLKTSPQSTPQATCGLLPPAQHPYPDHRYHPFFHRTIKLDSDKPIDVDNIHISLVVDGTSLSCILDNAKAVKMLSMLSFMCHSVICCRVSPIQKSDVVKLVKQGFKFKPYLRLGMERMTFR